MALVPQVKKLRTNLGKWRPVLTGDDERMRMPKKETLMKAAV